MCPLQTVAELEDDIRGDRNIYEHDNTLKLIFFSYTYQRIFIYFYYILSNLICENMASVSHLLIPSLQLKFQNILLWCFIFFYWTNLYIKKNEKNIETLRK